MHRSRVLKGLRRPLVLTRAGMVTERLTRAFWPLWSWAFAVWTALAFGLLDHLGVELAYVAALIGAGGLLLFLVMGLRAFRWPSVAEAAARLDRSLPGRPLTALWDNQAVGAGDAASVAVWQAHVARMAEVAAGARAVEPDLRISDRDPFGLRYVAATALVVALLFGAASDRRGLIAVLAPPAGPAIAAGPVWEGWIEPPRYTGLPTIYLNDVSTDTRLPVPEGARVTLRLYGQSDAIRLEETVSGAPVPEAGETARTEFDFTIAQSGTISVTGGTDWQIEMIADVAPLVAVTGPVDRSPNGEMLLTFEAADDYGVESGEITISLDLEAVDRRYGLAADPEPRPDIVLDLPMPFSGDRRDFTDTIAENLAEHPWAGLPVTLRLRAVDAIGQTASAEPESILLPGRRFFDPLAAAVVEMRRDLLWQRGNAGRVAEVLRAVSIHPEDVFDNQTAFLVLRSALRRIEYNTIGGSALDDVALADIADLLWQVALLIEDGDLSDAAERLRRAQERLSEALENGATEEEVARLTEELRRAMQEYLQQMAREAEQSDDRDQAQNGEQREITADQLQQMLERIEELFREGRNEEAQQLLQQLNEILENMQVTRSQRSDGQGQQAMRDMQDTLRKQQDLSDDSFRQLQDQFNGQRQGQSQPGQQGTPQARPGPGSENNGEVQPGAPRERDLAERQEALRDMLEEQRRNLPAADSEEGRAAREALRRAERAMGDARDALNRGDLPDALDNQAEALDALRDGLDNLGREIARNQNENMGRQGDQAGSPDPDASRDPLGRQTGTIGRIGTDDSLLPGSDQYMRSRELMDEIRRRSGDRSRPRIELDYLERLLDRF
ncbi:MAG: TIGR02302 family protein [Rhodobacteraceae bacterium]|nr:TIGR02302 family protein [Paracoccaceae bacterium]